MTSLLQVMPGTIVPVITALLQTTPNLVALNNRYFIMLVDSGPGIWTGPGREWLASLCSMIPGATDGRGQLQWLWVRIILRPLRSHVWFLGMLCLQSWWDQLGLLTKVPVCSLSQGLGLHIAWSLGSYREVFGEWVFLVEAIMSLSRFKGREHKSPPLNRRRAKTCAAALKTTIGNFILFCCFVLF